MLAWEVLSRQKSNFTNALQSLFREDTQEVALCQSTHCVNLLITQPRQEAHDHALSGQINLLDHIGNGRDE